MYRIFFAKLCVTSAELAKIELYLTIERVLLPYLWLSWFHIIEAWGHEFECVVFSKTFLANWSYRYALNFLPEGLLCLWIDTKFCERRQKWKLFLWDDFVVVFALKLFFINTTIFKSEHKTILCSFLFSFSLLWNKCIVFLVCTLFTFENLGLGFVFIIT